MKIIKTIILHVSFSVINYCIQISSLLELWKLNVTQLNTYINITHQCLIKIIRWWTCWLITSCTYENIMWRLTISCTYENIMRRLITSCTYENIMRRLITSCTYENIMWRKNRLQSRERFFKQRILICNYGKIWKGDAGF